MLSVMLKYFLFKVLVRMRGAAPFFLNALNFFFVFAYFIYKTFVKFDLITHLIWSVQALLVGGVTPF